MSYFEAGFPGKDAPHSSRFIEPNTVTLLTVVGLAVLVWIMSLGKGDES